MVRENLIQTRRGTAANWITANPTLAEGEMGFETDTLKFKIGDGITAWNNLAYMSFDGGNLDEQVITGSTLGSITLSDFFDTTQPMVKYQGVTGTTITVPPGYNYAIYVDSQGNITPESVTAGQTLTFKSNIILGTGTGQVWVCQSGDGNTPGCVKIAGIINVGPGGYPSEAACQSDCCQESAPFGGNGLFVPRGQSCDENCRSPKEICESAICSEKAGGNPGETRVFCNGTCCWFGEICFNGNCCDPKRICGNNCCSLVETCCNGVCCPPLEECCNGVCCKGTCCNGVCCPDGQNCCNGVCCNIGESCVNGSCCKTYCGDAEIEWGPVPKVGGGNLLNDIKALKIVCCAENEECCGKICCPQGKCCNGTCCGEDESCVNGQCAKSSSSSSSSGSSSDSESSSTSYYPMFRKENKSIFSYSY